MAKPRSDAYVGLLAISFIALVTAAVLLYLDAGRYEGITKVQQPTVTPAGN